MNRHDLNTIVKNYIHDLQVALHEPILKREIGDFPIDERKAFFVMLPLMNENVSVDKLRNIALSIGAIHAALDVHDRIHRVDATSAEQQLTVLAGDHFSGIHYQILAKNGEFAFIRTLSKTIAQINEQKTALQNEYRLTEVRLLERLTIVESACITSFYSVYGFNSYQGLMETILTYVNLKDMLQLGKQQALSLDEGVIKQALELIQPKLEQELEQISFLHPVLQQEIKAMITTSGSKS